MPDFFSLGMQVLQNYFEASGNVLDAAITAYKDYLANRGTESTSSSNNAPAGNRENLFTSSEGISAAYRYYDLQLTVLEHIFLTRRMHNFQSKILISPYDR
jgi:hypothetical protein